MIALLLLLLLLAPAPQERRFVAYDVVVETDGRPLAAWQLEVRSSAKIVGIEGGEPASYAKAPYYDPAALEGGRIVLAAFTTEAPPSGRLRIARIHMLEEGAADYASRLLVAAGPDGGRYDADIHLVRVGD
ncbi:MAG TPA: hypothetical protein VEJ18_09160 [Planctomycetota bacterium]|nr:hypothetical protein [Planctomycetota bacterium]